MLRRAIDRSAGSAAAAATARAIAGLGLEPVIAVRIAVDSDHRENDDSRGFSLCVDIPAGPRVSRLVGKSDDFAHFSPLSAPALNAKSVL
jgi:hypothetical protein